jgi:hypothetical protein
MEDDSKHNEKEMILAVRRIYRLVFLLCQLLYLSPNQRPSHHKYVRGELIGATQTL